MFTLHIQEQLTFPACLENLENQIKDSKKQLDKLQQMRYDAVLAKDSALRELRFREELNKNERKQREIELNALKKVAENKRSELDFSDKKLVYFCNLAARTNTFLNSHRFNLYTVYLCALLSNHLTHLLFVFVA